MTNLANIVMTGEQYSGQHLIKHDNNHPNVVQHAHARRNNQQDQKVYRGFGVPSFSVNQSYQKGANSFQTGNELSHDNNTDYMSPKSV